MIMLEEIEQAIDSYSNRLPVADTESLQLLHKSLSPVITSRANFPVHVTASAVIVKEDHQVLHIKHKFLNKWLLPGGHCEDIDKSLMEASLREAVEETGIPSHCLKFIQENEVPIDIDLHQIPQNPQKGEPEHQHADFRFVFRLDSSQKIILQQEEVTNYAWLFFEKMPMRTLAKKLTDLMRQKWTYNLSE